MRLLLAGLLALLLGARPPCAHSQFAEGGARAVALGGAVTALPGDVWGHANPAAWSTLPRPTAAFFASQAFGLPELRLGALLVALPTRAGTLAAGVRTFGFTDYREHILQAGFARSFGPGTHRRLHLGVRLHYERVSIPGFGQAGAFGLTLGTLVPVLPVLDFGMEAANLNGPRLGGDERARTLAAGLAYHPVPAVHLVVDTRKELRFPATFRAGVEVWPADVLALRTGLTTAPARFTAGAGLRLRFLTADVAAERHYALGWTPAVSLHLSW